MSGIAAFPRSTELREIFADVPVDRVLVETDSPYLAPHPHRSRRNEPAYLVHTAECLATERGVSFEDFCELTMRNTNQLFQL